jgi:hypothetical protein
MLCQGVCKAALLKTHSAALLDLESSPPEVPRGITAHDSKTTRRPPTSWLRPRSLDEEAIFDTTSTSSRRTETSTWSRHCRAQ